MWVLHSLSSPSADTPSVTCARWCGYRWWGFVRWVSLCNRISPILASYGPMLDMQWWRTNKPKLCYKPQSLLANTVSINSPIYFEWYIFLRINTGTLISCVEFFHIKWTQKFCNVHFLMTKKHFSLFLYTSPYFFGSQNIIVENVWRVFFCNFGNSIFYIV